MAAVSWFQEHPRGARKTVLTFLQAVFPLEIVITEESTLQSRQPNQQEVSSRTASRFPSKGKNGENLKQTHPSKKESRRHIQIIENKNPAHIQSITGRRDQERGGRRTEPVSAARLSCTISHLGQQLPKIWRDETQNKLSDSYSKLSLLMLKLPAKNYGI